ncbi:N-acetylmuramidase domain-containing protein [Paraprevotella clara]|uniref:N-acetylmuramidase domain-containing protein n=1 Tax=Paraprevotella clara TaxID=454154 RepID=UPI003AB67D58
MRTIKSGYTGNEVSLLRECMERNGYRPDGGETFLDTMKAAVIDFQKKNGLDADGIVGYRTWEALLFSGRQASEKLAEEDFRLLAQLLDCEPASLKAVQEVETGGRGGFFAPGKPAILFEGHIFWSQLKKRGISPEKYATGNGNVLYPKWEKGHYKGGLGEYDRLEQARKIHHEAADASASWGMFQIMGFNFTSCGEKSVESFVSAMCESERKQLILSGRFIRQGGMLPALQEKNWVEFARRYNGPAYAQNKYDVKLAKAYAKYAK